MCADFPRRPALNPPDGGRWTDDRLDDLANALWAMRDLPQRVAVHETELHGMRDAHATELRVVLEDLGECKRGIEKLHEIRTQERKEREKERKEREEQREDDRKERRRTTIQLAAVTIAAASMVITAIAVFVS